MAATDTLDIDEPDLEICEILKSFGRYQIDTPLWNVPQKKTIKSDGFKNENYQFSFPKVDSYARSLTNSDVLASFGEFSSVLDPAMAPCDSSLESDPLYKEVGSLKECGTSRLVKDVISKIISPVHESYRRELKRLEEKEKQLEEEESPGGQNKLDNTVIPFPLDTCWSPVRLPNRDRLKFVEDPSKTYEKRQEYLRNKALFSNSAKENTNIHVLKPKYEYAPQSSAQASTNQNQWQKYQLPPDPRPPPSFYRRNKPPTLHPLSDAPQPKFYDTNLELDSQDPVRIQHIQNRVLPSQIPNIPYYNVPEQVKVSHPPYQVETTKPQFKKQEVSLSQTKTTLKLDISAAPFVSAYFNPTTQNPAYVPSYPPGTYQNTQYYHPVPYQTQYPVYSHYEPGIDDIDDDFSFDLDPHQIHLRRQLQLSPTSKQLFADFFKSFKAKEKEGFLAAKKFASKHFKKLPSKVHWKVYLEMADLAKRENRHREARKYYEKVNQIQPYACKGWLEYAKMEEECGNLTECSRILADGLYFCPHSESLLVKGIKHTERTANISAARSLLSRLKNVAIERSWRTIMEGGLLESRLGNIEVARKIFKYLMDKVPSYGPIYTEAVRMEMRIEEFSRASRIVERGLAKIPSYGPLWFLALKIEETLGLDYQLQVEQAVPHLSKELVWKIYFELAQIEERKGKLKECRIAYVHSVQNCPSPNLIWKIWLGGARTELHNGNMDAARKLLVRALQYVPSKVKATTLLECARFEEFLGELNEARYVLKKAKKDIKHEWKVFLESALLEMRANNLSGALEEVKEALQVHNSTGRLWAVLIQLTHLMNIKNGDGKAQNEVFKKALRNVPKSGEVWCEGARIALHVGQLEQARKYLDFAIQFTPQYGDSFIEQLRLELLCLDPQNFEEELEKPQTQKALEKLELACLNAEPTYGVCWTYCKESALDSSRKILNYAKDKITEMAKKRKHLLSTDPKITTEGHGGSVSDAGQSLDYFTINTLDLASSFFGNGNTSVHDTSDPEFRFRAIFN